MISLFYCIFTVTKNFIHISMFFYCRSTEITFIITTKRDFQFPVLFRVDHHRIIFCFMDIKNSRFHPIFYFDSFHSFIYCSFCFTCNNRYCISHKTYMTINDQPVIRAHFRRSLSCESKTLLRHIFICKDTGDPRHFHGISCFNLFYPGIGVRTSQDFYDQAVLWCQIIGIYRFSCYQRHCIRFSYRLIYIFHFMPPPVLFCISGI